MINRINLTKKQCDFLDTIDKKITQGIEDSKNGKGYSIDEVRIGF